LLYVIQRGKGPGKTIDKQNNTIELAKSVSVFDNQNDNAEIQITLLNFGSLLNEALLAAETLTKHYHIKIINMRFIKPLDTQVILQEAQNCLLLITLEDNAIMGGAGSAVNEFLSNQDTTARCINLGIPDIFPEHASQTELYHDYGLDSEGIINTISKAISKIS